MNLKKRFFWLTLWGLTFGMLEAAVVIYLRRLYYPDGYFFPPLPFGDGLAGVEIIRELALLLMMWSLAELSYRSFAGKFATFMFLFGVWDIFYYIFLKLFLGWPESLNTWDILFLLPSVWVGPVWAPILVSVVLIFAGTIIIYLNEKELVLKPPKTFWLAQGFSGGLIILSFLIPGSSIKQGQTPESYPWLLLIGGLCLGLVFFGRFLKQANRTNSLP